MVLTLDLNNMFLEDLNHPRSTKLQVKIQHMEIEVKKNDNNIIYIYIKDKYNVCYH